MGSALNTEQALVIENQSAAGGIVGAEKVVRAQPDGYTLLVSGAGPVVFAPLLIASSGLETYDAAFKERIKALSRKVPMAETGRRGRGGSGPDELVLHQASFYMPR